MTHHWEALGWTLVHFLWQGAAIALLYRMADIALARSSANLRYVLAIAALISMPAVSLATLAYEEASYSQALSQTIVPSHAIISTDPPVLPLASIGMLAPPVKSSRFPVNTLMPYLDALWFAGVLALSLRTLGGWWLLRRLRLSPIQKASHTLLLHLDVLRRQMGIWQSVDLRLSARIANPLTAGIFRPWILLPLTAITSLSPEELEVVLLHELAHIRRADYLWNLLQTVVETLFFFHPAAWWISRRVREERELCCDDVAVERCSNPTVYAGALLRLEEARRSHLPLAMALDGHQSRAGLRARILRILGVTEEKPHSFKPLSVGGMAAALVVFLCPLPRVFASFHALPTASPARGNVLHHLTHTVPRGTNAAALFAADAVSRAEVDAHANAPIPDQETAWSVPRQSSKPAAPGQSGEPAAPGESSEPAAPAQESVPAAPGQSGSAPAPPRLHSDYIDEMRAAGYYVDLDQYIAMKMQGVTPQYAAAMSKACGSKLTAAQLVAMKVQGITPDYLTQMRAAGYDVEIGKYIAMKVQGITPGYADAMSKIGFGKPDAQQLIALKVQGVTPEYAAKLHASGIEASSFQDLISYRIFNVSPEFIAGMKAAGFGAIPTKKLIELRVQGVTPDFARSIKAQFPDVTLNEVIQLRVVNIDANFIASAERHGFSPITVQKLIKLRISGILDEVNENRNGNNTSQDKGGKR